MWCIYVVKNWFTCMFAMISPRCFIWHITPVKQFLISSKHKYTLYISSFSVNQLLLLYFIDTGNAVYLCCKKLIYVCHDITSLYKITYNPQSNSFLSVLNTSIHCPPNVPSHINCILLILQIVIKIIIIIH